MKRSVRSIACLAGTGLFLQASGAAIYTCTDASGRRISSDRPIAECMDREQRVLNPSGTVSRSLAPAMSAAERAAQEERLRKEDAERKRASEDRLRQRALLSRYPNALALERERAAALAPLEAVIQAANQRLAALEAETRRLQAEIAQRPSPPLQRTLEHNEQQRTAQERFVNDKMAEKELVRLRFGDMSRQLDALWAQPPAATPATASQR